MAKLFIFDVIIKLQNGEIITDSFVATNLMNCKWWIYHIYGELAEIISYKWY